MLEEIIPLVDQFGILFWIYLLIFFFSLCVSFIIYRRAKKYDMWGARTRNIVGMLIGLSMLPLSGIIDCLDVLFGSGALITGDRPLLVIIIVTFFRFSGRAIFILFYAFYVKESCNLSDFVRKVYNFNAIAIIGLGSISLMIFIGDYSVRGRNLIFFAFVSIIALATLIICLVFSLIDVFRISNKLTKVRLAMSILAGCIYMVTLGFITLEFILELNPDPFPLLNVVSMLKFLMNIPLTLFLLWSFLVPLKIQEWTGILPPSFKEIKLKQRKLASRYQ